MKVSSKIYYAIAFVFVFFIYFLSIHGYLYDPPVGRHGWNEALYMTFLHSITQSGTPFLFFQAYDSQRPDFNVGYVYFWAAYAFEKVVSFLPEMFSFRLISLISTFLSMIVLFYLLLMFKIHPLAAFFSVSMVLFSPLIFYYGWKVQLEPFLILLFFLSQVLLLAYIKDRSRFAVFCASGFILGVLVASRSNFIVFTPLLLVPSFLEYKENKLSIKRLFIGSFLVLVGMLTTILPSAILYPQYGPFTFLYNRIFQADSYAFSAGKDVGNYFMTFLLDGLVKQLVLLLPLSILGLFLAFRMELDRLKTYFFALGFLSLIFFALVYRHASNHPFQLYYGLLWIALAVGISLDFIQNYLGKTYLGFALFVSFFFLHFVFSLFFLYSYYGFYSAQIYEGVDAYGTFESYAVGKSINEIMSNVNSKGYALVQSPTVYYPAYSPAFTYYELYRFDPISKQYSSFSYFSNQSAFLGEVEKRNVVLLTVTPEVYSSMTREFFDYKSRNFVDLCYTKNFMISINKSVFFDHPGLAKECYKSLDNFSSGASRIPFGIRSLSIGSLSGRSAALDALNSKNDTVISSGNVYSSNNFTMLLFLNSNDFRVGERIAGIDDSAGKPVLSVKFGGNYDLYLEASSTKKGYGWMSGGYYLPFINESACVVFSYSPSYYGVYIDGVDSGSQFYLLKDGIAYESLPEDIVISGPGKLVVGGFSGAGKVFVFNQTFPHEDLCTSYLSHMDDLISFARTG